MVLGHSRENPCAQVRMSVVEAARPGLGFRPLTSYTHLPIRWNEPAMGWGHFMVLDWQRAWVYGPLAQRLGLCPEFRGLGTHLEGPGRPGPQLRDCVCLHPPHWFWVSHLKE